MNQRHIGRELALQSIYSWEINPVSYECLCEAMLDRNNMKENGSWLFGSLLLKGVLDNIEEIDRAIVKHLNRWTIDRLPRVDLSLLRLSSYEISFQKETPPAVVINEAVILAKEFCADEAYKYINGVLEAIAKKSG